MKREYFNVDIMSASPEVTGSCLYVTVKLPSGNQHFIVDCGIFQETDYASLNSRFDFDPANVDFVLLTHNHIDHTARLPFLVRMGFNSTIYTSEDTATLLPYALNDTASIIQHKAKSNKKFLSAGREKELNSKKFEKHSNFRKKSRKVQKKSSLEEIEDKKAIYTYDSDDIDHTMSLVRTCIYGVRQKINENISVTFFKNGHWIGASSILVQITCFGCDDINLFFTGDYNDKNMFFDVPNLPILVKSLPINIICESTYGEIDSKDIHPCFEKNLLDFFQNQKNKTVICPVFSLGRAQEILKFLMEMQNKGELTGIPIYLDGKLTQSYTRLFSAHLLSSIDCDKQEFLPKDLTYVHRDLRSTLLENINQRKIIVSSSGMGSYGPAQSYLLAYLSIPSALIHFTGYAAEGTASRALIESSDESIVTFDGILLPKRATIKSTAEFSAHAKADELINFLNQFKNIKTILVTHGAKDVKNTFALRIAEETSSKNVGILSRDFFFRINSNGLVKTISTKFKIF